MTSRVAAPETDFPVPAGFRWAASQAGIKYANRRDVGVCITEAPCSAAAVFTKNQFAAAPVIVSRQSLQASNGLAYGVVVNAGCANAATGEEGLRNARSMAELAARAFRVEDNAPFLVCSTGTIGTQLPMQKIDSALKQCAGRAESGSEAFRDFAHAILTTDTVEKIASAQININKTPVTILGCAKGSGMMQPDMATMLAYVFTDARIAPQRLQECLSYANERSLNCMTVDGDTSTNDTAILLASGASGAEISLPGELTAFQDALLQVMQSLAKQLARDGEGATKLIEVEVSGASDFLAARSCALKVANSPLVKTAIYGRDANWGRIAMAMGNANIPFQVEQVSIKLGNLTLFSAGAPLALDEEAALRILSEEFVRIHVDLGMGTDSATVWTCDLTEKYIEINGSYRT